MPLWSMKTKKSQACQIENFKSIITVEDHLLDGGFGSWLMESTSIKPELLSRIKIKSLDEKICGMVAKQKTLNEQGGLTEENLCI
jgi:transketolase